MQGGSLDLGGKVAIVTGGSRGIGRAVIDLLSSFGANVVVNYLRDEQAAAATVATAREHGADAVAIQADVARLDEAERLVNETLERFARIDFLICNAGIWEGAPVESISEELWDKTFDINLKGTWAVCRAAVPAMKHQKSGRIVIVSSTAGQRGEARFSNYAAAKGGQISFMKSLAAELGSFGINVNCVAPGWVDTDMTSDALANETRIDSILKEIPKGRVATPEDIAGSVVFLCSAWADHITGSTISVNGGSVL
ncbi:MAG TPA: SDR family NAD(P)-dependent oxidoreductase [Pyrinomonadaceae bacterium]|nr:SDR family NAD(P)-dependent oxidoreductase [Pyrinomonadaceae bacterium]